MRTSQACTRERWCPWSRGTCDIISIPDEEMILATYTLRSFEPSTATRVRLPTISEGKTRSSRIFSWTLVRVRERGRFCWTREVRVGLRSIRRCATNTTWQSENFFSNSRVSLPSVRSLGFSRYWIVHAPLLHLAERLQLGDGDEDDDGLLSTADIDLASRRNLEGPELSLKLGHVVFQVNERLGDAGLYLIGRSGGRVGRAEDFVLKGHLEGPEAKIWRSVHRSSRIHRRHPALPARLSFPNSSPSMQDVRYVWRMAERLTGRAMGDDGDDGEGARLTGNSIFEIFFE